MGYRYLSNRQKCIIEAKMFVAEQNLKAEKEIEIKIHSFCKKDIEKEKIHCELL